MVRVAFTGPFLDELAELNERAADEVLRKLELVASFPGVGSAVSNSFLVRAFSEDVLKVHAGDYDVFYRRKPCGDDEEVYVLSVIHQRRIR